MHMRAQWAALLVAVLSLVIIARHHIAACLNTGYELAMLGGGLHPLSGPHLGIGLVGAAVDLSPSLKSEYRHLWLERWWRDDWALGLERRWAATV